ncbi:MAG: DUF998 domain-containing protein [Thermoleophilaceae bacterium]
MPARTPTRLSDRHRSLPRLTPWALAVLLAIVGLLHVLDPRDPWRRFVSEYGVDHPLLLGAGFIAWALAAAVLAPALWRTGGAAGKGSAGLLVLFAALILVAASLQIDGPSLEPPSTTEGAIHIASGRAAVAALALALCLGWAATRGWRVAALVLLLFLIAVGGPVLASPTAIGLTQRVLVGVELGAMVLLARSLRSAS